MRRRGWATLGVTGLLAGVPVVALAAQDAPLGGVRIATFFGPSNCDGTNPKLRKPRCTYRPVDATVLVIDTSNGRTVAHVRTGNDGRGSARLPAGHYELRSGAPHDVSATPPQPRAVVLASDAVVDAILDYDPGQR